MSSAARIGINRADIRNGKLVTAEQPAIGDGEILVEIERFALTTNNVTYAAAGEQLGYWKFFPTGDDSTGIVPVWGFGRVTKSNCRGIEPVERIYGFWPLPPIVCSSPENLATAGLLT